MTDTALKYIDRLRRLSVVSRWFILLLDLACTAFAFSLSFILIDALVPQAAFDLQSWLQLILLTLVLNSSVFILLRTYRGMVRYSGIQDAWRMFIGIAISHMAWILLAKPVSGIDFPRATLLFLVIGFLSAVFSFMLLMAYRLAVKYMFVLLRNADGIHRRVAIFGAGEAGVATKKVLEHHTADRFSIECFIDDDLRKQRKYLDGIPVLSLEEFMAMNGKSEVEELILASYTLSIIRKNELVDYCLSRHIRVMTVPPYAQWSDGAFGIRQLKQIEIEELLEREPIVIDNDKIGKALRGSRILVTGAAGSIGSELVRQLLPHAPEMIILCDQAETPLHELELELRDGGTKVQCIPYLTDINHLPRMEALFAQYRPQYVYHAAAYKHVPMMEAHPAEAIRVNVMGTRQLADLATKYGVQRFVMVSTDKAVNPANIMGASKRLAEMYIQSLASDPEVRTRFITTRFGNVLGSNGSVIPRFRAQIEKGGPVTITHPEIIRYFMTIPEACRLVLEAGCMGEGGEIFVFDMGEPVKITDLARKMIQLYGLEPDKDIKLDYTGLRPGEKLYEELLNEGEIQCKTYHNKIMIAKVRDVNPESIASALKDLHAAIDAEAKAEALMKLVCNLVPEYAEEIAQDAYVLAR